MASESADNILNALLPLAHQLLEKYGEFFPFAAQVNADGTVTMVNAAAESEHPPSQQLIDMLKEGLRAAAAQHEINAYGICYDSLFRLNVSDSKRDAIACRIETTEGESFTVYEPYSAKKKFLSRSKTVSYEALHTSAEEPDIWR